MSDTIIARLRAAGVVLRLERGVLHVSPRNRVTPELRDLIARNRDTIIARLEPRRASDIVRAIWDKLTLSDLLALHGGHGAINWQKLALINATTSALWIVQRPDGLLTVLATVEPIRKPRSYANAWPARFTTPEPADDTASAASAAQTVIACARARARGLLKGS